jgi:4-cresol dehydrogenase (hydroxylating)
LELANRATFATTQRSLAILEPASRDEVAACLRIAHNFRVPVCAISTGRNWGYGSAVPHSDESVLLSLARLDRIVDFSEELAYVTVEPGVTFRSLTRFLEEKGSRLLPPITGTSPDASLVGNLLERGVGKGPYEDLAARSCAYEVILATGKIIRTGFASLPEAIAAPLRSCGPGPSLQGLFNQSNLGVITRLTLWLDPAPAWRQMIVFLVRDQEALPPALDALRERLLRSGSELQVEMINDYRYLASTRQYPYEEFDGRAALSRAWVAQTLRTSLAARWVGAATLWADSLEELELRRSAMWSSLRGQVEHLQCEEPAPGRAVSISDEGLRIAYWRKRMPMPGSPHPDRDSCGVLWTAPVIPMLGTLAARVLEEIEDLMLDHGFEPMISLRLSGGRSIQAMVGLFYDRDEEGMDERAARCHQSLREALYRQRLYPYRLGLNDLGSLPATDADEEVLQALKKLLDPHGILGPGRYISS